MRKKIKILLTIGCSVNSLFGAEGAEKQESYEKKVVVSAVEQESTDSIIKKEVNGIKAIVNNHVITIKQLEDEFNAATGFLRKDYQSEEEWAKAIPQVKTKILDDMIDRKLLLDYFDKKKGKVPESNISTEYDAFIQENFQNDRKAFLKFLKQLKVTEKGFRDRLKENSIVGFLEGMQEVSPESISPSKIKAYYNANLEQFAIKPTVKLKQIVFSSDAKVKVDQENSIPTAEFVQNELNAGKDFDEIAKKFNAEGIETNTTWLKEEEMMPELAKVAFNLSAIGQVSNPVTVNEFTFIYKLVEKKQGGHKTLNEVKDFIEKILLEEDYGKKRQKWINLLRKKAHIVYY